jgi:CRP/FNR family cyclic AMP-dependent transcriptional regulator
MGAFQNQTGKSRSPAHMARCHVCATRSVCIIGCVGETAAQALTGMIHEHPFRKSDVLQIEGNVSDHIAIVKLGTVEAIRQGVDGIERPVALFGRRQLIGAEGLLGERNQLSGKAVSTGRLCVVGIADLYRLGVIDRVFMSCVYSRISNSIGLLADWAHVVRRKGIQQQLLGALHLMSKDQGTQLIRLPSHVALAELLSTTRESVARNLRLLEQQGLLIRRDRWHCQLTEPLVIDTPPCAPPMDRVAQRPSVFINNN